MGTGKIALLGRQNFSQFCTRLKKYTHNNKKTKIKIKK